MQTVRIKCPKCNVQLDVKNSTGVEEKSIKCPNCGARLIVKFNVRSEKTQYTETSRTIPDIPKGHNSYVPSEDFGTSIMSGIAEGTIGKLLYRSESYPLQLGVNTIGRKAMTSKASIKIATEDRSMSRMHAVIEVSRLFNGMIRTVIKNAENKNPTFVGGQELLADDRIILNNGDVIKMGEVVMTFLTDDNSGMIY